MSPSPERRRFFRVTDEVGLKHALRMDEGAGGQVVDPTGRLRSDMLTLERQIRTALDHLRSLGNPVAPVLDLLNRKLNLVLAEEIPTSIDDMESVVTSVSLSACGMAFPSAQCYPVGTPLRLEITLLPSHVRVSLGAIVIAADPVPESARQLPVPGGGTAQCLLRVDFDLIEEATQEILIHHVLKCQSRDLRLRREAREQQGASS